MVGVGVGQQHVLHLFRPHARGAQVLQHAAHGGAKAVGGASVDQDQVVAAAHQIRVDSGLHAVFGLRDVLGGQPLAAARRVDVFELLHGQKHHAVKQRRDLQVADALAVNAGHLDKGRRGGGRRGLG